MLGPIKQPAQVEMSWLNVGNDRQVIVFEAGPSRQFAPLL
jgi:hypothetical protein